VEACSFTEFWSQFEMESGGRGKKGCFVLKRLMKPTITMVRPYMPKFWGQRGHRLRAAYCRVQLLSHKPFGCYAEFKQYMAAHDDDFEAAYEHFVLHDPDATPPARCRDDFASELTLVMEDDGEEVANLAEEQSQPHDEFCMYEASPRFAHLLEPIRVQNIDWAARTASLYDPETVKDAARWQHSVLQTTDALDGAPVRDPIDVAKLNDSQAFIYRVVADHHRRRQAGPVEPLRALVCGTAGSGKTWLIRALKQELGAACLVLAPTGVAADNIGGCTYHSKIPVPRTDPDRQDIRLARCSARLARMQSELADVEYIIIDEMSMVGRRSLGHIDELLRQATGRETWFGGKSIVKHHTS
jgi:ATP-dependent DNA helicase PIF1